MVKHTVILKQGIPSALFAALLFGCSTPLAKLLLSDVDPWMLAGLLYLGSGIGLALYRLVTRAEPARLSRKEIIWLAGAILFGGIVGPVLLMFGLTRMPASGASLLLNAEGVFTALLAWFAFKENFDLRIAFGMLAIVAGAVILSWPRDVSFAGAWPALAILGACLAWAIDNNLTRKVSLTDASWIASTKGLVAGTVNLLLALTTGDLLPRWPYVAVSMIVGLFAYGVSLALFVVGLRHLGTARTGAYFSIAPFVGAILAVLLGEPATLRLVSAGTLMAIGLWFHVTEYHAHSHTHDVLEHDHEHIHDEHHRHEHGEPIDSRVSHTHRHRHEPITHSHAHFPDIHHRHEH